MLRHVFESVLSRCMTEGLVGGEGFAIDASVIKADANRTRGIAGTKAIDWSRGEGPSRAVREYLATLDANDTDVQGVEVAQEPATHVCFPVRCLVHLRRRTFSCFLPFLLLRHVMTDRRNPQSRRQPHDALLRPQRPHL
jgi:hypothetical protein